MDDEYPDCYFFEGGVGQSSSRVNGEFHKTEQVEGGRPVYIHDDNGTDIALWFWEKKSFWMISPKEALGTQNAYACVRNSNPPHKIKKGWLIFSKENQNYVPTGLTAMVAGDEEDSSDSDSIDAQLLKPRERSKTPELDGTIKEADPKDRERTPSEENGIVADRVRFLKNPAPREVLNEDELDEADDLIEGLAEESDLKEKENIKEDDETTPKAPRDARYFMHDTRSKAPGRARGRCHMDDPEDFSDEEDKKQEENDAEEDGAHDAEEDGAHDDEEDGAHDTHVEDNKEETVEERKPPPGKKQERWGHEFFERIQKGERINRYEVEHWESSSFNTNQTRRRRGNFRGGDDRRGFDGKERRRDNYNRNEEGAGRGSGINYDYGGRDRNENQSDDYENGGRRSGRGREKQNGGGYGGRGDSYDNPYQRSDDQNPPRFTRGRRSRGAGRNRRDAY